MGWSLFITTDGTPALISRILPLPSDVTYLLVGEYGVSQRQKTNKIH